MNQTAVLIAGSKRTLDTLMEQLLQYVPAHVQVNGYALDEQVPVSIQADVLIVSSGLAHEELTQVADISGVGACIIAQRSIPFHKLERLVAMPVGAEVLLVNDRQETAIDTIEQLNQIGLNGPQYTPYAPGMPLENISRFAIAVTPGEADRVPRGIDHVLDIGPRVMDFPTIMAIITSFGVSSDHADAFSRQYLKAIIQLMSKLSASRNQVAKLNVQLSTMLDSLGDGLLLMDAEGRVVFMNDRARSLLEIKDVQVEGRQIGKLLRQRGLSRMLTAVGSEQTMANLNNKEVAVMATSMGDDMTLLTFKSVEDSLLESDRYRQELRKKGFYAKYEFEDILGDGEQIRKAKRISNKLAGSDLTILIEGESGTGKELFASAIHNTSTRRDKPFLAVNFSALPDNLIESELFGYVEGAFTGAKKGGKMGLFEQANGGTIFLDEIGDISHKVQARLLRVLQEGEFMPVGGSEIRTVDVRVVAATNRNLFEMVEKGEFRSDLYYRLKRGFIPLPPLRKRLEDIPQLAMQFLQESGVRGLEYDPEVLVQFQSYPWHGNVRELRNTVEYMIAVRESDVLTLEDLPEHIHRDERPRLWRDPDVQLQPDEVFLLEEVKRHAIRGEVCGREKLAEMGLAAGFDMTPHTVRSRLKHMEELGLIAKRKGRHGTRLTEWGNKWLQWNQKNTNESPDGLPW